MLPRRPLLSLALSAGLLLPPAVARANGRSPLVIDVHFPTGEPGEDVIAVQATWGVLLSRDGGDTWKWVCEEAIGFAGVYDPDLAFTSSGLVLATTTSVDGLRLTRDWCSWSPAPPPLGGTGDADPASFVAQVEVGPEGAIYAAAAAFDDMNLYVSTDDAASFALAGPLPDAEADWWESLLAAPTPLASGAARPHRLYLTGYRLLPDNGRAHLLLRSSDGGASWTPLSTAAFTIGAPSGELQLAAVSPDDPDLVFARVYQQSGNSLGDAVYRSADGGDTWSKVFEAPDDVTSVVIRRGGDVVVATRSMGAVVSTDGGLTFGAPDAGTLYDALEERPDGALFAGSRAIDAEAMILGRSAEVGGWTSLLSHSRVTGAVSCAPGLPQRDVCQELRWCFQAGQYGLGTDPGYACEVAPDAGVDAPPTPPPPPDDCGGCAAGGPGALALLGGLAALPLLRHRRRRA